MRMWEKLFTWTFVHVHEFLFPKFNTPFILLDKEKVHIYYVGLLFR